MQKTQGRMVLQGRPASPESQGEGSNHPETQECVILILKSELVCSRHSDGVKHSRPPVCGITRSYEQVDFVLNPKDISYFLILVFYLLYP